MSRWSNLPPPLTSQRGTTSPSNSSSSRSLTSSPRSTVPLPLPSLSPSPSHVYRSSSHADPKPSTPHHFTYDDDEPLPPPSASTSYSPTPPPPRPGRLNPSAPSPLSSAPPSAPLTPSSSTSSSPPSLPPHPPNPSDWEDDASVHECRGCSVRFSLFVRKHHCRSCGLIFCDSCSRTRHRLKGGGDDLVRVCDNCYRHLLTLDDDTRNHTPPATAIGAAPVPSAFTSTPTQGKKQRRSDPPAPASAPGLSQDEAPSSADGASVINALLAELRCVDEVMRVERAMRAEVDAMLLALVGEAVEGEKKGQRGEEVDHLTNRVQEMEVEATR